MSRPETDTRICAAFGCTRNPDCGIYCWDHHYRNCTAFETKSTDMDHCTCHLLEARGEGRTE